jgi:hypothetical protein
VPGWAAQGEARSFVADNLFEYMDGNAEATCFTASEHAGVTCV